MAEPTPQKVWGNPQPDEPHCKDCICMGCVTYLDQPVSESMQETIARFRKLHPREPVEPDGI